MDNERTFGVEMELISSVRANTLVNAIDRAFVQNRIDHVTIFTEWQSNTDGNNRRTWTIKTDSSIHPNNSNYPYPYEIVSPVLKDEDGLKALEIVCNVLSNYVSVNHSCGLHVHHAIKHGEDMKEIAKSWINCEKFFYDVVPPSRRINSYCKKWINNFRSANRLERALDRTDDFREFWMDQISERQIGLNFESYWMRSTVEFRLHSGTHEFVKIKNWVLATQHFINHSLNGGFRNVSTFESFIQQMKGSNIDRGELNILFNMNAKRKKLPKKGTQMATFVDCITKPGGMSKEKIMAKLMEKHGVNAWHAERIARVSLSVCKNPKSGFGWNVEKVNNKYILMDVTNSSNDEMSEVGDWLEQRKQLFA